MRACQDCGNLVPEFSSPNQHKDGCFHGPKVAPRPIMADVDLEALEQDLDAIKPSTPFDVLDFNDNISDLPLWTEPAARAIANVLNTAPTLIAELRRMRGQTCETCNSMFVSRHVMYCRLADDDGNPDVPCSAFGNGCRAHEPKAGV